MQIKRYVHPVFEKARKEGLPLGEISKKLGISKPYASNIAYGRFPGGKELQKKIKELNEELDKLGDT